MFHQNNTFTCLCFRAVVDDDVGAVDLLVGSSLCLIEDEDVCLRYLGMPSGVVSLLWEEVRR